ncbi:hypothetical protein MJH12_17470 [bacterium]|nr:hypothetical protein [bacterium]
MAKNYLIISDSNEYILYKDINKSSIYDLILDLKLHFNHRDLHLMEDKLSNKLIHHMEKSNASLKKVYHNSIHDFLLTPST